VVRSLAPRFFFFVFPPTPAPCPLSLHDALPILLAAGVRRVVVGTAALEDPDWVRRLAARHPGRVAVGLDARGREVAVRGWTEGADRKSTRLNSSHVKISYAVFCLKKKTDARGVL